VELFLGVFGLMMVGSEGLEGCWGLVNWVIKTSL
jgi:hypothetical protein